METSWLDRLDVYRLAVKYCGQTRPLVLRLRRADPVLSDQLHRAVTSIPLNTAEGAGEFSPGDKVRFYRYALRSATESVAIMDVCHEIGLLPAEDHSAIRQSGGRLVAMLTKLILAVRPREAAKAGKSGNGAES